MKDRVFLLLIMCFLLAFLIIFQNYFDTFWAIVFLIAFMSLYMLYMYIAVKHQRRKLRKNPNPPESGYRPFISIMVPCHNEEDVIEDTVKNILEVDYSDYEIILIDDRSSDSTPKIITRLQEEHEKVKILLRKDGDFPGKSAVLNDAMEIAKGEAILVFDADAKIKPDFIKKILIKLEPDDVGAVQARDRKSVV